MHKLVANLLVFVLLVAVLAVPAVAVARGSHSSGSYHCPMVIGSTHYYKCSGSPHLYAGRL